MSKVNTDQFVIGSRGRDLLWTFKRRHPVAYLVNRAQWYLYPNLRHVPQFPIHVDFETSSLCNMNCPMCFRPHRADQNDGLLDFDLYCRSIDECAENGLYSIRLSWRGEPTTHPRLVDMVEYAKKAGIKEVSFLTNGLLLNNRMASALIRAGLDYLSISIDGLYEDYERIRKPAKFADTLQRIGNLRRLRWEIGRGYPRIKVNTIFSQIKDHASEYMAIFGDLADIVSFNPDYDYSESDCPVPADHVCQYPFQRITIKWNGEVPMCISDWDGQLILGDLHHTTIKEIWRGDLLNRIRRDHAEGRILEHKPCRQCHRPVTEQVGDQRAY